MYEVTVIDNLLPADEFKLVQDRMLSTDFPWYYNTSVNKAYGSILDNDGDFQFTHVFYKDFRPNSDEFTNIIWPILKRIHPVSIIRIKANLLTKESIIQEHGLHTDIPDLKISCKTAVYYINTNNGYTMFEDGTKINSLENRLVVFDSNMLHSGSSCTDAKVRCVINFNYYETTL
jgi:hypothetical protein